jgi:hypothetical protein
MPEDNGNELDHALPLIFDRSHSEGLSKVYRTFVQYHHKEVDFMDEVKIALPLNIGPRSHLLFTFLHVSLKYIHDPKKKNSVATRFFFYYLFLFFIFIVFFFNYYKCRNVLGHAILPLRIPNTNDLLVLLREEFSLRVATKLIPGYFNFILTDTQVGHILCFSIPLFIYFI